MSTTTKTEINHPLKTTTPPKKQVVFGFYNGVSKTDLASLNKINDGVTQYNSKIMSSVAKLSDMGVASIYVFDLKNKLIGGSSKEAIKVFEALGSRYKENDNVIVVSVGYAANYDKMSPHSNFVIKVLPTVETFSDLTNGSALITAHSEMATRHEEKYVAPKKKKEDIKSQRRSSISVQVEEEKKEESSGGLADKAKNLASKPKHFLSAMITSGREKITSSKNKVKQSVIDKRKAAAEKLADKQKAATANLEDLQTKVRGAEKAKRRAEQCHREEMKKTAALTEQITKLENEKLGDDVPQNIRDANAKYKTELRKNRVLLEENTWLKSLIAPVVSEIKVDNDSRQVSFTYSTLDDDDRVVIPVSLPFDPKNPDTIKHATAALTQKRDNVLLNYLPECKKQGKFECKMV